MSFTDIKTKDQGFTIVELLIVVVVIAILAAITIVSYNGITNRANASAASSLAASVGKKAEAYNAEESRYPLTTAELTGAATSKSYNVATAAFLDGSTTNGAPSASNGKTTVQLFRCQASGTATASSITATTITGVRVAYWAFDASPAAINYMKYGNTGTTSKTATAANCWVAN